MTKNKTYSYHDQTNLARWIKRLAIPYFLGLLFVFALDCYKLPHLNSILAILPNPEFDYLAAEDAFDEQVGLFYLLFIPFIIVWLIETLLIVRWIYRAAANTYALNIPIYYKPHWSVTGYIIPIVNFIVPYRAMRQIAENSTQAARQTPFLNLLGYWWATWLASGIISTISSWLEKQSDKAIQAAIEQAGEVRLPAIPPEAIHLSPHSGTLCTLQHSFRLPIGYRIEATHPQFGAITFFHDQAVHTDDCRVAVDASRVVAFD